MNSIKAKLTATILVLFIISLGALGGLNYWKARGIIGETITNNLQSLAGDTADKLDDFFEARQHELQILASNPALIKGNTEEIVPILLAAKSASKYYDDVVYVDRSGTAFTSGGLKIGVADREYYIQAMAGNAHTTDPLFSRSTGNLVCNIALPIKSSGRVIGVVFGSADMKEFSEAVQKKKAGQTGYAYVLQSDGLVVVHPEKELVMKVNSVTDNQFSSDVKAVNARIAKGETGIDSYEYQGKERYVAFAPLAGTKLRLAINVPKAEVC